MTQAAKAQDPSMEEILASIRRIIADDEAGKAPEPSAPPASEATAAAQPAPQQPVTSEPGAPAAPPPEPDAASQADIDSMLANFAPSEGASDAANAQDPGDILELTEAMEVKPTPRVPSFRTVEPQADVVFAEPTSREPPVETPAPPRQEAPSSELMSEETSAAVASAFGALTHTVLVQNARTLDDLVLDMLRPMLKSWLDENLPGIVERLVRAEIERVSRGRG
ncbi:MAG: DUF2497 domain-containing protein [Variibacter sp.]|nr:DUF2497 domain-containing protein [Variibacter sp.]